MDIIIVSYKPLPGLQENKISMSTGGWVAGVIGNLIKYSDYNLTVVYPESEKKYKKINDRLAVSAYVRDCSDEDLEDCLKLSVKNAECPAILVFGTETEYQNRIVNCYEKLGCLDRIVIWIQGIASEVYKSYNGGLPESVINKRTLKERILHNGPYYLKRGLKVSADLEDKTVKKCKNIIGRTNFDKSWAESVNPKCRYFHCDETMREAFYEGEWDYSKCEKHSVFVSQNTAPFKGYHDALKAVANLKSEFPDIVLYTTGRDFLHMKGLSKLRLTSYEKYLIKTIKKLKIENNVKFLGTLNAQEMRNQFLKSNAAVLTSSVENSPNSLCEAMLLGVPSVASDVGGVKDFLTHDVSGYVYPFGDTELLTEYIRKIFTDEKKAEEFSTNAKLDARIKHDEKNNCERLIEILKEVAGE